MLITAGAVTAAGIRALRTNRRNGHTEQATR